MREAEADDGEGEATRGRRPAGVVRRRLVEAGLELARAGGPDAVVLREATRRVGVAPNAAYRHFADRDALLGAVCTGAMRILAERMDAGIAEVDAPYASSHGATARLAAIGRAYLAFARSEPGLFETAFAVPDHLRYANAAEAAGPSGRTALQLLAAALDELAAAGVLPPERRPDAEHLAWSSVHGLATLVTRGPLRELPPEQLDRIGELLLAFIGRGL